MTKYMSEKLKVVLGKVENIVGKVENAGDQHFLLFPQFFQLASFFKVVKSELCGKGLTFNLQGFGLQCIENQYYAYTLG